MGPFKLNCVLLGIFSIKGWPLYKLIVQAIYILLLLNEYSSISQAEDRLHSRKKETL